MQQRQRGFTLIEIMVVVVILGILAALVVPQVMSRPDQAKVTVAKGDIKAVAAALDMYKLDNFAYPSTQQGLEALVKKPSGNPQAKNWNKDGYLKRLPVQILKIDRTFVSAMVSNASDAVIVHSTIALAHNFGMQVVAEGVEYERSLRLLERWGCDTVQGYLISRPLSAEAFETWHGQPLNPLLLRETER